MATPSARPPGPAALADLLALDRAGDGRWRSRPGEPNRNGRTYGGHLLGLAMAAALAEVPDDRDATMMQFVFLQGTSPDAPVDLQVTRLQDGARFSTRHVRGSQGDDRTVFDAQVTCASPLSSPQHEAGDGPPPGEHPDVLPTLEALDTQDARLLDGIERLNGYARTSKPSIDFRIPDAARQLAAPSPADSFRYWLRARAPLPPDGRLHAAAFAFMSDWWLNYASLGRHRDGLGDRSLYISSLNHAIWLHRPVRADRWLHFASSSPAAGRGRGLSVAAVSDADGRRVATVTQECLLVYAR